MVPAGMNTIAGPFLTRCQAATRCASRIEMVTVIFARPATTTRSCGRRPPTNRPVSAPMHAARKDLRFIVRGLALVQALSLVLLCSAVGCGKQQAAAVPAVNAEGLTAAEQANLAALETVLERRGRPTDRSTITLEEYSQRVHGDGAVVWQGTQNRIRLKETNYIGLAPRSLWQEVFDGAEWNRDGNCWYWQQDGTWDLCRYKAGEMIYGRELHNADGSYVENWREQLVVGK